MPRIYAESGGMEGGISVERFTDKHFNKSLGYYMKCSGCCERSIACNECEEFEALVDRLGAIEDILGTDYDLDRLRELVEADRDGRCVVLPLKEGNPVWKIILDPLKNTGYITDGRFKLSDMLCWGKSVFPSPEEAADALKGYLNGN